MSPTMRKQWPLFLVTGITVAGVVLASVYFFVHSNALMREQLRSKLRGIAATAAMNVDGDELDAIDGPEQMTSEYFVEVTGQLKELREQVPGIRFAYIVRRANIPFGVEFVADADALATEKELDDDGDGVVEPQEEGSYPGDIYDITDIPELQGEAFFQATASREVYVDQWGALISGYAPIRRSDGSVSAVLAIDMNADEFLRSSQSVFSPAALLSVVVLAVVCAAGFVVMWERKQRMFFERMNSERSGLLRLTFHQLGEPLTIMKWSLETLRDETESEELKHMVADHIVCMDEGLGRLNSIIDTLQLAEKVDLNSLEYLPVIGSLRELIDNAVNEWTSSFQKRKQHIHIFMNEDITMSIDKTLLGLVFRQLIVNAIEYSDDGAEISISVVKEQSRVHISIEDHGCGIPKKDMERLFEKYRRASNAHLKRPDGNGLGLYISRGVVEKAGGRMWVESEVGNGTQVHFTLPLE